jgi:hypothetical protein
VRYEFWKTVVDCVANNRQALPYVMMMAALYLHLGPFSHHVIAQVQRQVDNLANASFGPHSASQPTPVAIVAS